MARATTSLPAPLSPVIRTFASERATRSISALSSVMTGLVPIIWTGPWFLIMVQGYLGSSPAFRGAPGVLQTGHRRRGLARAATYRIGKTSVTVPLLCLEQDISSGGGDLMFAPERTKSS